MITGFRMNPAGIQIAENLGEYFASSDTLKNLLNNLCLCRDNFVSSIAATLLA